MKFRHHIAAFAQSSADAGIGRPTYGLTPLPLILGALVAIWASIIAFNAYEAFFGVMGDARILLLDVDAEDSVYTWFSQMLLAAAGALLLRIAWEQASGCPPVIRLQWYGLGLVFFALSLDETISLHERLVEPLHLALNTSGAFRFAWIIPYGLACLVGLLGAIPFLRGLPKQTRALFLISAAVYIAGAIGLEMVGGALYGDQTDAQGIFRYRLEVTLEEALEGLGAILFLYSLASHRKRQADTRADAPVDAVLDAPQTIGAPRALRLVGGQEPEFYERRRQVR